MPASAGIASACGGGWTGAVTPLNHYLSLVQPYLDQYGYAAVFAGILLEDFGFPSPGEALLIAGTLLADQGRLHLGPLLGAAWLGAVLGDNVGYAIGRFGGRSLVLRFGTLFRMRPSHLDRVEGFFRRYGAEVVIGARFVQLLRQLNGIAAGLGRMPWWRFLAYNASGAALWVTAWGAGVYLLGRHLQQVWRLLKQTETVATVALAVALLILAAYAWQRRRRSKRSGPPAA
jgi:membrane protein DedA with SNARE-associated domain